MGGSSLAVCVDALRILASRACEHVHGSGRCWHPDSGYELESAKGWAVSWCDGCIAEDALIRAEAGGQPVREAALERRLDVALVRAEKAEHELSRFKDAVRVFQRGHREIMALETW